MRPSSDLDEERRLREELMRHQQEGDTIGMLSEYAALGVLYQEQGELAKAEGMYLKALGVGEELEISQVQIRMCTQLGLVCERQDALDRAGSYLEKTLALAVREGDRQGEAMASGYLAHFIRQTHGESAIRMGKLFTCGSLGTRL